MFGQLHKSAESKHRFLYLKQIIYFSLKLKVNLLVLLVCLEGHHCQVHQVVQHAQEKVLQWWQMRTGGVQGDQEVLEGPVDQEDPNGRRC